MTDADRRVVSILEIIGSLPSELGITVSDGRVWLAFAVAIALGAACTGLGASIARRMGLIAADAPRGEVIGIGLGTGLVILATTWATIGSSGRSAYAPVALAAALALGADALRRRHVTDPPVTSGRRNVSSRSNIAAALACAGFIVVIGLLFGATLAPSPRNGEQPVEFFDTAFYSVLGADLARTGVETLFSPAGFGELSGLPSQTWYHWGEIWLGASVISIFGTEPILARHFVVLPLLLLAAAALTGTLVRRAAGTSSRGAFVFGVTAALLLAPLPLPVSGLTFTEWASGLVFGITHYGLAVVPILLIACATIHGFKGRSLPARVFTAALVASIIPSHPLLAAEVALGAALALTFYVGGRVTGLIRAEPTWVIAMRPLLTPVAMLCLATVLWGFASGHGFGASGSC